MKGIYRNLVLIIAVITLISLEALTHPVKGQPVAADTVKRGTPVLPMLLESYNQEFQKYLYAASKAEWELNTHIVEGDTMAAFNSRIANRQLAAFTGNPQWIEISKRFMNNKGISPLERRQVNTIYYKVAKNPASEMDAVSRKVALEADQVTKLFGYDYKIDGKSVTTNQIDGILRDSTNLKVRLQAWESSKMVGAGLKDGLIQLQKLRNELVQKMEYSDFFDYQVREYGMNSAEMIALCDSLIKQIWPLYRELHTWARYELAAKYGVKRVPDMIPAHWLPNRWGQDWTAMIDDKGLNVDDFLAKKGPEYIIKEGERFYLSLGFDSLPQNFYANSSLYPVPEGAGYRKNNHASAWHMDYDKDIRSLMSIEPNTEWWSTALHELGHIYYYMQYSRPEVPIMLREGANRGFHEAMGSLMGLASLQRPFLEAKGMVPKGVPADTLRQLLKEALDYIVHIPWGAGVMTHFEEKLYASNADSLQLNKEWWDLVRKYQGIEPPSPRGEEYCDAATKTHIIDDPAQYYDYSISNVLLFMFHQHIAKDILKQNPHATNYWGSKATGDFLKELMKPGATVDWRGLLKDKLGSDMSAQPMVDYFQLLMEYLKKANKGRKYTLPETI
ncbi:MAG TPA: M2 family metallopeptidase [Bacteroidia bacterium]|nr:M2 family metallopeptidase [Bacteroidia bacterium]